ncbi:uncharacterized protein LOC131670101 [Phymastichus coffea]|uniref:uncharacterized protein LOC131670101 n=1 Tax=Phymastichus coffea TaxID=108790 RepID=UPI00273C9C19|nr:uncharacterized protein LOC131670101 [Phymastichus coffea]
MVRLANAEDDLLREIAFTRRFENRRPEAPIDLETRICNNCNITIRREIQMLQADPNCTRLNVLSHRTNNECLVCHRRINIHRLSLQSRVHIFVERNIYVPARYCCCNEHLDEKGLLPLNIIEDFRFINRPYILNGPELQSFVQAMREEIVHSPVRRYEDERTLTDEQFAAISPISKDNFNDLFTYSDPVIVPGGHRYVSKKDLLCFLCKLKQGLSDEFLWVMFHYSSRQATSLAISTVRQSLMTRFVDENIGFGSITREEYIERHITPFANRLYNATPEEPTAIVYNDCTYLNIEKSSCFKALRQSFCVHKNRHLLKPAMFVAPDGYILDIQGPYFSNAANNDARILSKEFQMDVDGMQRWFRAQDIFILDRGYRDAIPILTDIGLVTLMPPLLDRNQAQFSTEDANQARIITKTRWIVEARNGHLKSLFKFFANVIPTSHIPNLTDFLRIAGAIINKYHRIIMMPDANVELAEQMLNKVNELNLVQARVEVEGLQRRRGRWDNLTAMHVPLFPNLTLEYLRGLTYGTYQVGLAPSYVQDSSLRAELENEEEIGEDEQTFEIDRNTNEPGFMRIRISSRFRNATKHQVWIAFNEEYNQEQDVANEGEPIFGYYCTCKAGARTLGTCAHVATILWYLGYARHENQVHYPSLRFLRSVQDAQMDIDQLIEIIDPLG